MEPPTFPGRFTLWLMRPPTGRYFNAVWVNFFSWRNFRHHTLLIPVAWWREILLRHSSKHLVIKLNSLVVMRLVTMRTKRHWNTVDLDGSIGDDELRDMIEHSYELVLNHLPKAERAGLTAEPG